MTTVERTPQQVLLTGPLEVPEEISSRLQYMLTLVNR